MESYMLPSQDPVMICLRWMFEPLGVKFYAWSTTGGVYANLVLTIFGLNVVKVLLATINQWRLLQLPSTSWSQRDYSYDKTARQGSLKGLHMSIKIMVVVMTIGRLAITGYFAWFGAKFLA